ncbi:mitochondrial substrate carrier family protein E-like isoform X2 [Cynara cardunculus var. scolymus]|uniref:mitochondrial substrate carrier family protein E-like isoform X2 n=1 Tax=Cynara cardunculus var. scolymus TaxID=59895 RepID=UPI000D62A40A|nr:mitochondrial substrate carrier family protein E-like isoform X2 [Cynara cardunculus var. scolymus]
MNLSTVEEESSDQNVHTPTEIDWHMLDKSKFFFLGAGLFSCVSATLYPVVVLKTRQQVSSSHLSSLRTAFSILRYEGLRGLYRGFGTSLIGTIPARALYMTALEVTKSNVGSTTVRLGFPEPTASAIANAMAGLSAALAAQLVWTPVDVVSQRLMVQGNDYSNSKISSSLKSFWWASYSVTQRLVWDGIGSYMCKKDDENNENGGVVALRPDSRTVMAVQGVSAAMAGGVSALVTMPLDTIKTRLQVLDCSDDNNNNNGRKGPTVGQTVRNLVKEGGWMAFYRGLGPRWASMSLSATTMITTYELLKRLSTKNQENLIR